MDESHRLKKMPMPENYDEQLFNVIYKETKALRKKLAFDIDGRKYGVDQSEVLSCFDVKLIYIFNKYYGDPKLKGYIINGLKMFKAHTIKHSYSNKNHLHQTEDITEKYDLPGLSEEGTKLFDEQEHKLQQVKDYLKKILSEDAYFIFEIDLNPPPYILERLKNSDQKKIPKIPAELIADFLGIISDDVSYYISTLRKEVEQGIQRAHYYFSN